jgi:hypothetical protein
MIVYLSLIVLLVFGLAVASVILSVSRLSDENVIQSGAAIHLIGGIICTVLVFICSLNLFRLIADYSAFKRETEEILDRCRSLLDSSDLHEQEAYAVMHDYQTARCMAPLLPSFIWNWHNEHLNKHWRLFRSKPSG